MKKINIAIDGPAGAGKSTMSRYIAQKLGIAYLDTGAMYRAAGLKYLKESPDDIGSFAAKLDIDIKYFNNEMHIYSDGEDVTDKIRTKEVSIAASDIAVHRQVREKMVDIQRNIAKKLSLVMDGRDIGSFVLKDADIKIFLTATVEDRARRRFLELEQKGETPDMEEVKKDIAYRDNNDSTREFAPLVKAADAISFDTTGNTLEESKQLLYEFIKEELMIKKYRITRAVIEISVKTLMRFFYKIVVTGSENVPASGPLIICANHSSYLDVPVLQCYIRRLITFIAKKELYKVPVISFIVRSFDSIPVDRDSRDVSAAREAYKRLRRGRCIGIFPEGTRSVHIRKGKKKYRIRTGAVKLAVETGSPILPVGIKSSFRIFSRIEMIIGKPLYINGSERSAEFFRKESVRLMDEIYGLTGSRNEYIGS